MGYPYDKTYLEQIQSNKAECKHIRDAYYILRNKYLREHKEEFDVLSLSLSEQFAILGEAFEHESFVMEGVPDTYHFVEDVLDALLETNTEGKE